MFVYSDFLPKGILDLSKTFVNRSLSPSSIRSGNPEEFGRVGWGVAYGWGGAIWSPES